MAPATLRVMPAGRTLVVATVATWVLLTPPSWYRDGPGLILSLAGVRVAEYSAGQSADGGLFIPARYIWPFELAVLLCATVWISRRHRDRTGRDAASFVGSQAVERGRGETAVDSEPPGSLRADTPLA